MYDFPFLFILIHNQFHLLTVTVSVSYPHIDQSDGMDVMMIIDISNFKGQGSEEHTIMMHEILQLEYS